MNKIERIEKYIKKHLSEKRVAHSYSTAETALKLNDFFKLKKNKKDIIIAALSHDSGKSMNRAEMERIIGKYDVRLDSFEKEYPELWHSHISAALLEHKFGITQKNIIKAVKYHTTGHIVMSGLLKIIYIADYTEPLRIHNSIDICQYNSIDILLFEVIKGKLGYLNGNNGGKAKILHPLIHRLYEKYSKI